MAESPYPVGERVRELRKRRKWSQEQLAGPAKISVSMLSQIENGKKGASVSTLQSLADALGVSLSELFREEHA